MKALAGALAATLFVVPLASAPAHADPTRQERENPELAVAGADAAIVAYGQWLQQLQAAQAPFVEAFSRLAARFRPGAPGTLSSLIDETNQVRSLARATAERVRAIPAPDIRVIPLAAELQPARLQREQLAIIAEMERVADHMLAGLEAAARGDRASATRSFEAIHGSVGTMLRQRILFARAMLEVMPRSDSGWDIGYSEVLALRSAAQMLSLFSPAAMRDEGISRELTTLADEFASTRRSAAAKMASEAAETGELSRASAANVPSAARLLRRARGIDAVAPRYLGLMDEWERFTREAAGLVMNRSISQQELSTRLLPRFTDLRQRGDEILAEMAAVMAAN